MLLVRHHQRQPVVNHLFLDQGVGADDQIRAVGSDFLIGQPFLLRRHGTRYQNGPPIDPIGFKEGRHRFIMLSCQYLRGRHQRPLIAVFRGQKQRQHRDDRFSGTNIPLDQPVHDPSAL